MKKYLMVILFLLPVLQSGAYELQPGDFLHSADYQLYCSWLNKGGFKADNPVSFGRDKIEQTFRSSSGQEIKVFMPWRDHHIVALREDISDLLTRSGYGQVGSMAAIAASLLFTANAMDSIFFFSQLSDLQIEMNYGPEGEGTAADFWSAYRETRFSPERIIFTADGEVVEITMKSSVDEMTFIVSRKLNETAELNFWKNKADVADKYMNTCVDPSITDIKLSLDQYLSINHDVKIRRELLHNKIGNFDDFLQGDFPDYEIRICDNSYYLVKAPYEEKIQCEIRIELHREEDGILIQPSNDFQIDSKGFYQSGNDFIDLSSLSSQDINFIAPYLSQLVYEHRALGSRLLNFLLIHDDVPTTLILYSPERQMYEFQSYADLLLLLNNYWQESTVYFDVSEFRKMNDYIEFKGLLLAVRNADNKYDSAEIWFHLGKDYKIDLIMMVLYSGNQG